MLYAIISIIAGIIAGYIFRNKERVLKASENVSSVTIYILLFFMGIAVGTNSTVLGSFHSVGKIAFILTFGALAGSIIFSFIIDRLFFKE